MHWILSFCRKPFQHGNFWHNFVSSADVITVTARFFKNRSTLISACRKCRQQWDIPRWHSQVVQKRLKGTNFSIYIYIPIRVLYNPFPLTNLRFQMDCGRYMECTVFSFSFGFLCVFVLFWSSVKPTRTKTSSELYGNLEFKVECINAVSHPVAFQPTDNLRCMLCCPFVV